MNKRKLIIKNLIKRPAKTFLLVLLASFMSFTLLTGAFLTQSLLKGIESVEQRLGADIIVVPSGSVDEDDLKNIFFKGTPDSFYMEKSIAEDVVKIEGIEQYSFQYFLASSSSDCCSAPVQIIGFDEESDFVIAPWVEQNYKNKLAKDEIIAGSNLSIKVGEYLKLYGIDCKVVGKLSATGTGLDTAVYANKETIKHLIEGSKNVGLSLVGEEDPDDVVSAVYIKVKKDSDISVVSSNINFIMKGLVDSVRTRNMISDTGERLAFISKLITGLVIGIWLLSVIIMGIAFSIGIYARRNEFALLRVIGFSKRDVSLVIFGESVLIGLFGALSGSVFSSIIVLSFAKTIEASLELPFLLPSVGRLIAIFLITIFIIVLTGPLTASFSTIGLCREEIGNSLRK